MNIFFKSSYSLVISFLLITNIYCGKITLDINKLDVKAVEKSLQEKGPISEKHKNKLIELAEKNIILQSQNSKNLLKSKKDLFRIFLGTTSTLTGTSVGFVGIAFILVAKDRYEDLLRHNEFELYKEDWENSKKTFMIGALTTLVGCAGIVGGIRRVYRGWKLKSATANFNKAVEIKNLIKNWPIEENEKIQE